METVNLKSVPAGEPGSEAFIQIIPKEGDLPVPIDGIIHWEQTGSGFTIEPDAGDFKVCKVIATDGNPETCLGTVVGRYDADTDEGQVEIRTVVVAVVVEPRKADGETVTVTYPTY